MLTVNNPNSDATATFVVKKKGSNDTWTTVTTVTDRSLFEGTTNYIPLPGIEAGDVVKIITTTLYNSEEKESNEFTLLDYRTMAT